MKYILAVCIISFFTSFVEAKEPYIIRGDMGGRNATYFNKFKHLANEGRRIIIDGDCASACTLVIHKEAGSIVCITPRARMGFHQPYRLKFGFVNRSTLERDKVDKVWQRIVNGYPPTIRRMVINAPDPKRGARTTDILWLEYKDLRKAIKPC